MPKINYEKYLVTKPIKQGQPGLNVRNRTYPPMIYMSSAQVPEAKYNIEFGWVWGMPQPASYLEEIVRDNDEIILNIGGDCYNPEDLGADIEYTLGGRTFSISTTGSIFIPKGVKHGPLTYKKFRKPHVRISIILGTGERQVGTKSSKAQADYSKYIVKKPAYEVLAGTPVKNRQGPSSMTFMSNNLVPGSNIYVEGGWVFGMPDPNPHIFEHVHDYEELVLHFGTDYNHPEELGAEIEFSVGGQPLTLNKTSMVFVPKSVKHGPLVWKKYSLPHLEMAIMPGAGTLDEADPGGHREKMKGEKGNG